jgi:hypothetical protein
MTAMGKVILICGSAVGTSFLESISYQLRDRGHEVEVIGDSSVVPGDEMLVIHERPVMQIPYIAEAQSLHYAPMDYSKKERNWKQKAGPYTKPKKKKGRR